MDFPRSSHQQQSSNGNASVPEILSLPSSSLLVLSMERLNEESEHLSPSLELHSVCSYNSLSSLSSCGSEHLDKTEQKSISSKASATSRPRLIFKSYWKKSGSRPSLSRTGLSISTPATASVSSHSWDSNEQSAADNNERILKQNKGIKSSRRSIFDSQYKSTSSLSRPYHPAPLEQKAKSDSELQKKRLPSCLRSTSNFNRVCSSSVSFDCEVSVITYSSVQENWAAEGWSEMFHWLPSYLVFASIRFPSERILAGISTLDLEFLECIQVLKVL